MARLWRFGRGGFVPLGGIGIQIRALQQAPGGKRQQGMGQRKGELIDHEPGPSSARLMRR